MFEPYTVKFPGQSIQFTVTGIEHSSLYGDNGKLNVPWIEGMIEQVKGHNTRPDGKPKDPQLAEALKQVETVLDKRREPRV